MGGERPKWLSKILDFFKQNKTTEMIGTRPKTRFVKSTEITIDKNGKTSIDEIGVELLNDQPDEFARSIAHTFRTGKGMFGSFDEKTGKWISKEID